MTAHEVVTFVRDINSDWCEVINKKRERGVVPRSYLGEVDDDQADTPDQRVLKPSELCPEIQVTVAEYRDTTGKTMSLMDEEPVTVLQQLKDSWVRVRRASGEEGIAPSTYLKPAFVYYRAVADYKEKTHATQLIYSAGDNFLLLAFKANEWLRVKAAGGREGLVAARYVEPVTGTLNPNSFTPAHRASTANVAAAVDIKARAQQYQSAASTTTAPKAVGRRQSVAMLPATVSNVRSGLERHQLKVVQWSKEHVEAWAEELGDDIAALAPVFRANDVDGKLLFQLTKDDLQGMGIASLGLRNRVMEEIEKLKRHDGKPVNAAPTPLSLNRQGKVRSAIDKSIRQGQLQPPAPGQPPRTPMPRRGLSPRHADLLEGDEDYGRSRTASAPAADLAPRHPRSQARPRTDRSPGRYEDDGVRQGRERAATSSLAASSRLRDAEGGRGMSRKDRAMRIAQESTRRAKVEQNRTDRQQRPPPPPEQRRRAGSRGRYEEDDRADDGYERHARY
jgi:hypothetical protein